MAITCDAPTPHFSSGCALLLVADSGNDGVISDEEVSIAQFAYEQGWITKEERDFIAYCWYFFAGNINSMCSGCFKVVVTFVTRKEDGTELKGVSVYLNGIKKGET
jgi:hypothetical protein